MDLKLEQRRMRTLRRLVLKLFGSLKQDKLVSFFACFFPRGGGGGGLKFVRGY